MTIVRYDSSKKGEWDAFVERCKNYHFMFNRDYMDYHADRYEDCSLMIYDEKGRLNALFPANVKENSIYSHQGLTFGGLLLDHKASQKFVIQMLDELLKFYKSIGIYEVLYKSIPYIYHIMPAQEDLYAIQYLGGTLIRRDPSSAIDLRYEIKYSSMKKRNIKKAQKSSIEIKTSQDFRGYWGLLTEVLRSKYKVSPVHTLDEITNLKRNFPNNIRLFLATLKDEILAGIVIYETKTVAHTQYLSVSESGKELFALDLLIDYLIKKVYSNKRFFDFGISSIDSGKNLNEGLIGQKEGFGAHTVIHDFYRLDLE